MITKYNPKYREVALALLFILDHQPLDVDAQAAAEIARRRFFKLERKKDKTKGG